MQARLRPGEHPGDGSQRLDASFLALAVMYNVSGRVSGYAHARSKFSDSKLGRVILNIFLLDHLIVVAGTFVRQEKKLRTWIAWGSTSCIGIHSYTICIHQMCPRCMNQRLQTDGYIHVFRQASIHSTCSRVYAYQ